MADTILERDVTVQGKLVQLYNGCPKPGGWFAGKIQVGYKTYGIKGVCSSLVSVGMILDITANLVDSKYGKQYDASHVSICTSDSSTMRKYLASSNFPGIGNIIASRLVSEYGDKLYEAVKTKPDDVKAKCGLNDKQMTSLIDGLSNNTIQNALEREYPHLGAAWIREIIDKKVFSDEPSFKTIKFTIDRNPYVLLMVRGLSFRKADEVALYDLKLAWNDDRRVDCVFKKSMEDFMNRTGSTYLNLNDVSDMAEFEKVFCKYLGVSVDSQFIKPAMFRILKSCTFLTLENFGNEIHLYHSKMWTVESNIIRSLIGHNYNTVRDMNLCGLFPVWNNRLDKYIKKSKQEGTWGLCKEQEDAVRFVFNRSLSCIIGGPGRGKTHVIRKLIDSWMAVTGGKVLTLAPTGKAVNRMKEATGYLKAETLARFIMMNSYHSDYEKDDEDYIYDELRDSIKVGEDVLIIVDESSMVDFEEGCDLLRLTDNCHVVFVGDAGQLPPIEPGAFFREMLVSGVIDYFELKVNHRTKSKEISDNADLIKMGDAKMQLTNNFQLAPMTDNMVSDYIVNEYQNLLKNGYTFSDILLLAPVNRGVGGVSDINTRLQSILNPYTNMYQKLYDSKNDIYYEDKRGLEIPGKPTGNLKLRIYDRVMNTQNHVGVRWSKYKDNDVTKCRIDEGDGIFNGDTGTIIRYEYPPLNNVREPARVVIQLDDNRIVRIPVDAFGEWVPGYCVTIHKSQGCEAKVVMIALTSVLSGQWFVDSCFLNRNLMYTAVTRGQDSVQIVGNIKAFKQSVVTEYEYHNTVLSTKLNQVVTPILIQRSINGQA